MSLEEAIFISYSHIDNGSQGKGWVSDFHRDLQERVEGYLGDKVTVWRDDKLGGNDIFDETIRRQLAKAAILISVVSPRYFRSEWCLKELGRFCEAAGQSGGVRIEDKSRVFKVVKTPDDDFPPDKHPGELKGSLGYPFYKVDDNGTPREFERDTDPYRDQIEDLAYQINKTLRALQKRRVQVPAPVAASTDRVQSGSPPAATVYLANTTSDLREQRERIERELKERNCHVLPDGELPLTLDDFEKTVRADIARCKFSIHLIGESYGTIPEGEEERSIISLQNEIAAERGDDPEFSRLIWMPVGLEAKGNRQRQFIEHLQRDPSKGADLLQTPFEELKTRIQEKLMPPPEALVAPDPESGLTYVYLIFDNRDFDKVDPLYNYLFDAGFEVIRSGSEVDKEQVAQFHRESLLKCDATLIYYGCGNEQWLRTKLWDLQKAPGWGRTKPMRAKAIYVSEPQTSEKKGFRTREVPLVLQNFEAFSPDALQPFLTALGGESGGQK